MNRLIIAFGCVLFGLVAVRAQEPVDENIRLEVESVLKLFERKKYEEVVQRISSMPQDSEVGAVLLNLQGAAYTKLKNYAAAKSAFEKALEKSPGMFAATFNQGEILFLQRKYPEALAWFSGMLANDPRNELLQFKVFMCQLLSGDTEAARKSLSRMKFPGDTPAWYFASAAWELQRGNRSKASDFLDGARYIFSGKTEIYEETFADLGWPTK